MWRCILLSLICATCAAGAGVPSTRPTTGPDPLDGLFVGNKLSVSLTSDDAGQYSGTIQRDSRRFPFACSRDGNRLTGTFQSEGHSFDFHVTLVGDQLTLESGGASYTMARVAPQPAGPTTQPAVPSGQILRRTAVIDPMTGCNAAIVLVPDGWKSGLEVLWRQNPFDPAGIAGGVSPPNSVSQWRIYSRTSFIDAAGTRRDGESYMGSEVRLQFSTPGEYVRQCLIPRFRTDIASPHVDFESELTDFARDQVGKFQSVPGVKVKASRLRLSYRIGGKLVEEDFICTFGSVPLDGNMIAWGAECESYRAEQGRLDRELPLLRTIASSLKIELPWFNSVMQVGRMMQQDVQGSLENAASLARCIAKVDDQISDAARKTYRDRAMINARCNQDLNQVVQGMVTYDGPADQNPIELPSGHEAAYISQSGDIVLADKPDFAPDQLRDWRELKRQAH
jgi:hypothetical protein